MIAHTEKEKFWSKSEMSTSHNFHCYLGPYSLLHEIHIAIALEVGVVELELE